MEQVLVQVDFEYTCSDDEILEKASQNLSTVQETEGLLWKIWTHNPEQSRAGSINYFSSRETAEQYLNGSINQQLEASPRIRDVSLQLFEVMEDPSRRTNAPL